MNAVTLDFSDEQWAKLEKRAVTLGVSVEELIRGSVEELLTLPQDEFDQVTDYVLKKNAELYRRLS